MSHGCARGVLGSTQNEKIQGKTQKQCFTLDATQGTFLLTANNIQIVKDTQEFANNKSNSRFWSEDMRWNATMVGDEHRVLTCRGIFLYPSDNRNNYTNAPPLFSAPPMKWMSV
ncbi:MAG TPA: hypothetical protein VLC79_08355 [Cellvibrio sp.]|nr:hypothetical protein [Cellvibrio sp.]